MAEQLDKTLKSNDLHPILAKIVEERKQENALPTRIVVANREKVNAATSTDLNLLKNYIDSTKVLKSLKSQPKGATVDAKILKLQHQLGGYEAQLIQKGYLNSDLTQAIGGIQNIAQVPPTQLAAAAKTI